jgi:hypothetical protein
MAEGVFLASLELLQLMDEAGCGSEAILVSHSLPSHQSWEDWGAGSWG